MAQRSPKQFGTASASPRASPRGSASMQSPGRVREEGLSATFNDARSASSDGDSAESGVSRDDIFGIVDPRTTAEIKLHRVDLSKRYVFLCPMSLAKNFSILPQQAKDDALLVLRSCREWVLSEGPRSTKVRARVNTGLASQPQRKDVARPLVATGVLSSNFDEGFIRWLLTKEREGCVFWLRSAADLPDLSSFFAEKFDPLTEYPYRPLLLDPLWWRVRFVPGNARYVASPNAVINNIAGRSGSGKTGKAAFETRALQELIYQSNPTLEPITKWPHAPSQRFLPRVANREEAPEAGCYDYLQRELGRVVEWPRPARERRDDLIGTWRAENMATERRALLKSQ